MRNHYILFASQFSSKFLCSGTFSLIVKLKIVLRRIFFHKSCKYVTHFCILCFFLWDLNSGTSFCQTDAVRSNETKHAAADSTAVVHCETRRNDGGVFSALITDSLYLNSTSLLHSNIDIDVPYFTRTAFKPPCKWIVTKKFSNIFWSSEANNSPPTCSTTQYIPPALSHCVMA